MKAISSERNKHVKHLINLRKDAKYRKEHNSILISGKKVIDELSQTFPIKLLVSTEKTSFSNQLLVTKPILKKITNLLSPDGYAAEFSIPKHTIKKYDRLLVCDDLQDPGNLGTLFRTALAFGFSAIFLLPGCVDPFNDKALRASKGSVMHMPFKKVSLPELKRLIKNLNIKLFLADLDGKPVSSCSFKPPFGIILGNEGHGTTKDLKKISTIISLPMKDHVDSLNVSVCGSILMYLSSPVCQMK